MLKERFELSRLSVAGFEPAASSVPPFELNRILAVPFAPFTTAVLTSSLLLEAFLLFLSSLEAKGFVAPKSYIYIITYFFIKIKKDYKTQFFSVPMCLLFHQSPMVGDRGVAPRSQ